MSRWRQGVAGGLSYMTLLGGLALLGCDEHDLAVDQTSKDDFTLSLEVADRFVHVGDEVPIVLRFRRTDNSNLEPGMRGQITITTTAHGRVDASLVEFDITGKESEIVRTVVFLAESPGLAEIRATIEGASVVVEVVISNVE